MNGNQIVYRTLVMKGTSEGLDKLAADLNKVAAGHKDVTVASEKTEKSTLSLEQAMQRQALRLDEVARAQANIARETKLADSLLKNNLIDAQRHAELLSLASQRYGTASKATAEFGTQTGLARHELINLGRQAQDVGVSLASGQSPLMVLAQQGSQIADVFISSGKSVGGFFSQAIDGAARFLPWWGGIATAVAAVGTAAILAASQFFTASKTIEQALEEQNRLLKEGKALTEAKTAAEAQMLAQSKNKTRFETQQNEIDLQKKLNDEIQKTIELAERRAARPTQVPGEMGEAPTGLAPFKDPGFPELYNALEKLKSAWANNQLGARAFSEEVSRIGLEFQKANPSIVAVVKELLKIGTAGAGLELTNLQAKEAAAAYERQAAALQDLAANYPGMTIEGAKQLQTAQLQLQLTQARTAGEKAVVQEIIDQNTYLLAGLPPEESLLIAAEKRKVAEEGIAAALAKQVDYAITAYEREQGMQTTYKSAVDATQDIRDNTRETGNYIQNNTVQMENFAGQSRSAAFWARSMAEQIEMTMNLLPSQFGDKQYTSSWDPLGIQNQKKSLEKVVEMTGEGRVVAKQHGLGLGEFTYYEIEYDKSVQQNTEAIKENTAATTTMTDVLSPFYSSDPRRTHLGFRSFAGGGIMTAHGELPLKQYQGGGVATSPQVAVYGEGRTPEAYVPVPSGRIPVELRQPANSNQRPIHVTINVRGNADANTVAALKSTAFQQAQVMRRAMR